MTFAQTINDGLLHALDWLFGWVLLLPRDLGLLAVAALTSVFLVGVRRWTTDQQWLTRARADQRVLKKLQREAKQRRDRQALTRHRTLNKQIGLMKLTTEGKPLLWAIIPVAVLAFWCYARLPFIPPVLHEHVEVRLNHPASATGQLVHLMPSENISTDSWIKPLRIEPTNERVSVVTWKVLPAQTGSFDLVMASPRGRFTHTLFVGSSGSEASIEHATSEGMIQTELSLKPRRLFGFVPGIPALGLPAWLVGYLVLTVALIPVTRKVFGLQ